MLFIVFYRICSSSTYIGPQIHPDAHVSIEVKAGSRSIFRKGSLENERRQCQRPCGKTSKSYPELQRIDVALGSAMAPTDFEASELLGLDQARTLLSVSDLAA